MPDVRSVFRRLPAPVHGALFAAGFLSRFPAISQSPDAGALGWSIVWFPWVGAALGTIAAVLAATAAGVTGEAPLASGIVYTVVLAYASCGLHLDGVADLTDGLAGGRGDRERALSIMRDSRMGALGGVSVSLLLLAKVVFSAELIERQALMSVALAPAAARAVLTALIVALPYARASGLGAELCRVARWWSTALAIAPLVAIAPHFGLGFPLLGAVAGASWIGWLAMRRLGGTTGDVYGAAVELSEVCWLLAALGVEPALERGPMGSVHWLDGAPGGSP